MLHTHNLPFYARTFGLGLGLGLGFVLSAPYLHYIPMHDVYTLAGKVLAREMYILVTVSPSFRDGRLGSLMK